MIMINKETPAYDYFRKATPMRPLHTTIFHESIPVRHRRIVAPMKPRGYEVDLAFTHGVALKEGWGALVP